MFSILRFIGKSDPTQVSDVSVTLVEPDRDGPVAGSLEGVLQVCASCVPGKSNH